MLMFTILIIMKMSVYIGRVRTKHEKDAMITAPMLIIIILLIMKLSVFIGSVRRRKETGEFVGGESKGTYLEIISVLPERG